LSLIFKALTVFFGSVGANKVSLLCSIFIE
jgi:hypothetical protein